MPPIKKFEPVLEVKAESKLKQTVSLEGEEINEDDVFSQWNDQCDTPSPTEPAPAQKNLTTAESKSIWKQIFSKPAKVNTDDDQLKQQWSELDKDQPTNSHRFQSHSSQGQRTCPFYKKIPGNIDC